MVESVHSDEAADVLHLWDALLDAGLVPRRCRTHPALRTLAQRWLASELDAAVDVPVAVVCVALNLDATALAGTVHVRLGLGTTSDQLRVDAAQRLTVCA